MNILVLSILCFGLIAPLQAQQLSPTKKKLSKKQTKKKKKQLPNILVMWGDDVGWFNISAYNRGMMGYRTPNIDRIAAEGALCTDMYSQQSCTAGRSAFITGQSPIRTGLTKVGLPGTKFGISSEDPTIAELLKPYGYTSGQFGKNHLGDLDEMLPTNHGFDEYLGNLYHMNAHEELENPDYPKDPAFKQQYGPRGVIHSYADGTITDTGPLTTKRMETIDDETLDATINFIEQAHTQKKPFFVWWNANRMHVWTHLKEESQNVTGFGVYADGMIEHDALVGKLLEKLDELGIAENTIVIYSTDNGAEIFSWPDGGMTPFRGEKGTNWEGGFRVPCVMRWPGVIQPGTIYNDMFSHEDWLPTFLAAAGNPDIVQQLYNGYALDNKTYKVHLDGYNLLPFFKQEVAECPRHTFMYWNDDGELTAVRYNNWKYVFAEQRERGIRVWAEPFVQLRAPKLFNLRSDPFERADRDAIGYQHWNIDHLFMIIPVQDYIKGWIKTFMEFPPRHKVFKVNMQESINAIINATVQSKD